MSILKELLIESKKGPSKVPPSSPRNKQLHQVLSGRKGGRHYDPKRDYVRAKEKDKAHRNSLDESVQYFWYTLSESSALVKGCIAASSEAEVGSLLQTLYPTATNVLVGTATSEMYHTYISTGDIINR